MLNIIVPAIIQQMLNIVVLPIIFQMLKIIVSAIIQQMLHIVHVNTKEYISGLKITKFCLNTTV